MRILFVCTANICRSASAQQLLREAVAGAPGLEGVEVLSAGTAAVAGAPGCSIAPALAGRSAEHHSQPLTSELVAGADLIVAMAGEHRKSIVRMDPAARARVFTIRQAGRIAEWMVDVGMVEAARERRTIHVGSAGAKGPPTGQARRDGPEAATGTGAWATRFPPGDPRRDVTPLPADDAGRWLWVAGEMDAARGMAAGPPGSELAPSEKVRRFGGGWLGRLRARSSGTDPTRAPKVLVISRDFRDGGDPKETHPDDVLDPHVLGTGLHAVTYQQLRFSTDALARLLRAVAAD